MESELINIRTGCSETVVDLTAQVTAFLRAADARDGLLHVFVPHATAGVAVIETGAGRAPSRIRLMEPCGCQKQPCNSHKVP